MDNEKVWGNIANKITDESGSNDEAAVQEWINQDKENKKVFDRLLQIWQFNPKQIYDNSTIYRKYLHRRNQFGERKTVTPFVYYALRISAVLFFLVASIFIVNSILISTRNEVVYQEISVPKGSRSTFNLPDGTKVWLSNNSTIKYPSKFIGRTRELEIEGEAYFEVTHK
ncbi:MAG: FecR domain-containing protein, partial [Bacteroidota bacterium]